MPDAHNVVHATSIALNGRGALICGPSGSGKSDLALRCLMQGANRLVGNQAELVADDYTLLRVDDGAVFLSAPESIRDQLEVRGIGIVAVKAADEARLVLVVELTEAKHIERLPDPFPRREIAGVSFPVLRLAPFEASAASKLLLMLEQIDRLEA